MGIYDRDYIRNDSPNLGPSGGGLIGGYSAVAVLIMINVAVFILWQIHSLTPFMAKHFLTSRYLVFSGHIHTLVTSEFSHMGGWHIGINMFILWMFGRYLEPIYGSKNFVVMYLFCGIVASVGHIAMTGDPHIPALGASGSVMGIVIVTAFLFPNMELYIWGILPMKLKWLALLYIGYDLLPLIQDADTDIAHAAHLGGALAGALFYKFDLRVFRTQGRRLVPSIPSQVSPTFNGDSTIDAATAERVDGLLDKISRDGISNLTEEERQFLIVSSKKYRK